MAEFVYAVRYAPNVFKVGYSADPNNRFKSLRSGIRFRGMRAKELEYFVAVPEGHWPRGVERRAHRYLDECRYGKTEFFHCTPDQVRHAINLAVAMCDQVDPHDALEWVTPSEFLEGYEGALPRDDPKRVAIGEVYSTSAFIEVAKLGVSPGRLYLASPHILSALNATLPVGSEVHQIFGYRMPDDVRLSMQYRDIEVHSHD